MRRIIPSVFAVFGGALCFLLVCELVLQLLPVCEGAVKRVPSSVLPIMTWEPNRQVTHSAGWALRYPHRHQTNNVGFLSPFDYEDGEHPVVVIGDSFVEAALNDWSESLCGRLQQLMRRPTYNMGMAGSAFSEYVRVAGFARRAFHPEAVVVLAVTHDIEESLAPLPGKHHMEPSGASWTYRLTPHKQSALRSRLSASALVRYLALNLRIEHILRPKSSSQRRSSHPDSARVRLMRQLLRDLIYEGGGGDAKRIVLVLEANRADIYRGESGEISELVALGREARALGIAVVDMAPIFAADFERHQLPFDFAPVDAHWNARAHNLAAQAVQGALRAATKAARLH